MSLLLGLCVYDRESGEHSEHVYFTADEVEAPGFVEAVEKSYEGSQWITARLHCDPKPDEKSFVYTLVLDIEYEGERLLGVYSTIELAKAAGDREAPRHTEWAPVESGGVGTEEDLYCYETEKTVSTILAITKTEVDKDLTR